jgi:pyruvate dehydrogenase E2 component (dihydrolipoamide acetyltransferase)
MARPIVMPSLGMYTAEGTVTSWLRPSGTLVHAGDPILEVTTDKDTYELPSPADGLVHWVAELGDILPVQGLIGYVLAPGEAPPVIKARAASIPVQSAIERQQSPAPPHEAAPRRAPIAPGTQDARPLPSLPPEVRASPVARRLAQQHGLDISQIAGSGPNGRIVEADVEVAIARLGQAPAEPVSTERRVLRVVPLAGMRRTIAERLRQSLATTLHVTLTRDVDAEALVAARRRMLKGSGSALPYDAFFVKLFAQALREHPELNAVVENDTIVVLGDVHIGVAVAVPGGLVAPVVRDADGRSIVDIADAIDDLSRRAQVNQLRATDLEGGTATITNLGSYGIDAFTPIINPPQSAILGVGRIQPRPVVVHGQLVARNTCTLSLSFDHRVADGVPAAVLLNAVASGMQADRF